MLSNKFPCLPSTVDFHRPLSNVGRSLDEKQREEFDYFLLQLKQYLEEPSALSYLSQPLNTLLDDIAHSIVIGPPYDEIVPELVRFLRISLTSSNLDCVKKTTKFCDVLVKNCGDTIHKLIGRRYFMKTISLVARRQMAKLNTKNREVGLLLLDTIQVTFKLCIISKQHLKSIAGIMKAWGEAFSPFDLRREYPNYFKTYFKLKTKYQMPFGEPFDPRRVPIFLGPLTSQPKPLQMGENQADVNLSDENIPCPNSYLPTWEDVEVHDLIEFSYEENISSTLSQQNIPDAPITLSKACLSLIQDTSHIGIQVSSEETISTSPGNPISELMSPTRMFPLNDSQYQSQTFKPPPPPPPLNIRDISAKDLSHGSVYDEDLSFKSDVSKDDDGEFIVSFFGSQRIVRRREAPFRI